MNVLGQTVDPVDPPNGAEIASVGTLALVSKMIASGLFPTEEVIRSGMPSWDAKSVPRFATFLDPQDG